MSTPAPRRLRRRPSRVVPASIVAVVLLALGALTVVAAVARLVTGSWPAQATTVAGAVAGLTLGSAAVITTAAVALVLGVVLLLAGVKPGGFRSTQLRGPEGEPADEVDYVITNAAVARLAVAEADRVDGVDKVGASVDGRRVRLRVTTSSEQGDAIRDRVVEQVSQVLVASGLDPAPRVSASVTTKEL